MSKTKEMLELSKTKEEMLEVEKQKSNLIKAIDEVEMLENKLADKAVMFQDKIDKFISIEYYDGPYAVPVPTFKLKDGEILEIVIIEEIKEFIKELKMLETDTGSIFIPNSIELTEREEREKEEFCIKQPTFNDLLESIKNYNVINFSVEWKIYIKSQLKQGHVIRNYLTLKLYNRYSGIRLGWKINESVTKVICVDESHEDIYKKLGRNHYLSDFGDIFTTDEIMRLFE